MSNISENVIERLEAEAQVSDADPEELTVAVETDIEESEQKVESLQAEVDEKESEVEELEEKMSEMNEEIEELREEVDSIAETYAEELAAESPAMSTEDYLGAFDFEELQEKHEEAFDGSSPNAQSGDMGAGFQSAGGNGEGQGEEGENAEELSDKAKAASDSFEKRGGIWKDIAEDIEEEGLGEVRRADRPNEEVQFG